MEAIKLAIKQAVITGFIDENHSSFNEYRPSILTNDPITNAKVLNTILEELRICESFFLSVAFITSGGVASILGTLMDLEEKGVKGKILVSEYLNFTEPEALRKLLKLTNIELKIARDSDFHSKGFLFSHPSYYSIIIGSSNLTQGALTKNKEWNLKVTAHKDSELFKNTLIEFNQVFETAHFVDQEYLEKYTFIYNSEKKIRSGLRNELLKNKFSKKINPNLMQQEALKNLENLRGLGKNKALLVSATGTGKTYLSAFDVLKFKPKKLLFLVHRKNIAQKAMETFHSLMDENVNMSLYTSNNNSNANFIFSTIQTFSRDEHLNSFEKNHFDYIIIDETHRASASSYQKILNYFKPRFLLGMTATPERTDGLDVFQLFDYNIAYEIRLHDALAQEMLVPFHYYGVTDIEIDGQLLDENTSINDLNRVDRVNHIIENLNKFGTDDGITRGLIFCSKNEESTYLSNEFNQRGFKTISLSGNSSEDERSRAIDLLETDDLEIKLDYIFSVDIFNEGIDIPRLNQVVMLRPTQSAIIFVQQLGRGLRKREGKSYLTVIDFIGNYQNNFLVPIALFGDKSYSKENLRKLVNRPEKAIVGASTIHFSRIIKEKIFHSIDTGKLQEKRKLVEEFKILKGKIGRIPTMIDFIKYGERDPFQYIQNYESFYYFLLSQKENIEVISKEELDLIKFLSNEVLNPIRFIDIHLFKTILETKSISIVDYKKRYFEETYVNIEESIFNHTINVINGLFVTEKHNKNLVKVGQNRNYEILKCDDNCIKIGKTLINLIQKKDVLESLLDLCNYSIWKLKQFGKEVFKNDFILNQRYSRKDVFRILCWETNPVAQNVGGYMISPTKNDCAIFVNYHKEETISATTKYHDRFISSNEFVWMSKNKRKLNSPDVCQILEQKTSKMRIPLFVKKSNSEGNDFYYLGNVFVQDDSAFEKMIKNDEGKNVSVVEMKFNLTTPVEKSLYDYITSKIV